MMEYPELNERKYEVKDKTNEINDAYDKAQRASADIITSSLENTVNSLNRSRSKIPSIYKNLRNNLTLNTNKLKKATEEYIANTGNHTAGGYAMSERMNNNSAYLNELNSINQKEREEINEIDEKIRDANNKAREKIAESDYKIIRDKLSDSLKENERVDNLNYKAINDDRDYGLKREKLSEEKRVNDSSIKINEEKHNLEMMYKPKIYDAELVTMDKGNQLTDAKISKTISDEKIAKELSSAKITKTLADVDNEKALTDAKVAKTNSDASNAKAIADAKITKTLADVDNEKALTDAKVAKTNSDASNAKAVADAKVAKTNSGTGTTRKTSQSSNKDSSGLKLSATNIAKSIREQSTTYEQDYKGNKVPVYDTFKAYTFLLSWKKKYNLSDQMVDDVSVLLQIQGYF